MLHLLGIDHKFQVVAFRPFVDDGLDEYNSRDLSCAFEQYLDRVLDRLTVTVIAEEYSHRQLERMRLTDPAIYSVAERACERRSRRPRCEPIARNAGSTTVTVLATTTATLLFLLV